MLKKEARAAGETGTSAMPGIPEATEVRARLVAGPGEGAVGDSSSRGLVILAVLASPILSESLTRAPSRVVVQVQEIRSAVRLSRSR